MTSITQNGHENLEDPETLVLSQMKAQDKLNILIRLEFLQSIISNKCYTFYWYSTKVPSIYLIVQVYQQKHLPMRKHLLMMQSMRGNRYNTTDIPERKASMFHQMQLINLIRKQQYVNSIPRYISSTSNIVRNFFSNEHAQGGRRRVC